MSSWTYHITRSPVPQFEAIGALLEGGSKFLIVPPDPMRSWALIDRNRRHAEYFWSDKSESLPLLLASAASHDFPDDAPSWSRLCKWILQKNIMPEPSKVKPHPYAIKLATDKRHWHATKCRPGWYESVTEIDIKSAYAQAVATMPSLLMRDNYSAIDDYGSIGLWQTLYPKLDKRTRLAMIGWLSGYQLNALQVDKTNPRKLEKFVIRKTYDGGVFNCIHVALYNLYRMLRDVDAIDPDNVPRIHTDSMWIDSRIRTSNLERMLDTIKGNNFKLAVKGHGMAKMWDLNTAVLGGRLVGTPMKVISLYDFERVQFPEMMTLLTPLDERFKALPYRNERYSIKQAKGIMKICTNADFALA